MSIRSVLSAAPLRISFLGGGTDFASYYSRSHGAVLSAAIDKYVYVHLKMHDALFQERYRVSYSTVEHCQRRDEIENDIVRASLELLDIDLPLQISTSSDLPANSGLGSSSSFAVALLLALHNLRGESVGASQLAEEACKVEIDILKSPIGKQDQYSAAFGGLNLYEFFADEVVRIEPLSTETPIVKEIFANSSMIWTQQVRKANFVLKDQEERAEKNLDSLSTLKELTYLLRDELKSANPSKFRVGELISSGWRIKQSLSPLILTEEVSALIDEISEMNILGIKLLGAGAGGFVYSLHDNLEKEKDLISTKWSAFLPLIDHQGARILASN
jgi:D-glycero-alpha-D-manno-heptose-7-phosphate kinase